MTERLDAVRSLMARELPAGSRLAQEYPLAFDERFGGQLVALEEKGELRSACVIVPRNFVCGEKLLRVGLIGSVVTDPAYRRRGWMGRLLDEAERRLLADGCAFSLLWADDPSVYTSRGYVPFGHEIDYLADGALCAALPLTKRVRPFVAQDAEAVHGLYAEHRLRVQRSLEETRALFACPEMQALVLPSASNPDSLEGYACVGRGHDLANVVHEWGGGSDAVMLLVRAHQARRAAAGLEPELVLMTPAEQGPLHAVLDALGARRFDGILGLAKPLDASWLADELRAANAGLEVAIVEGPDGARALVAESASAKRELPLGKAMQALFPPAGDLGAYHYVSDALRTSLPGPPLRPFAWGLDSI